MIAIWVGVAVAALMGFAPITRGRGGRVNAKQLERFRSSVALPLPPALAAPVLARIGSRERWALCGGVIGIATGVLLTLLLRWEEPPGVLIMFGVALGGGIGGGLATVLAAYRAPAGAPRLARPRRTQIKDYMPSRHLVPARGMLGRVLVACALELALTLAGGRPVTVVLVALATCAGVSLAVSALTEVVARLVVDRPQRASSSLELAWDDVLRADAAHQLTINQVVTCAVAAMAALLYAGVFEHTGPPEGITIVALTVALIASLASVAVVLASPPRRYVLDRLWPGRNFADGTGSGATGSGTTADGTGSAATGGGTTGGGEPAC